LKTIINNLSVGQKVMTVIIVEVISYSMVTTIALSQIHTVGVEVKQMADVYLPLFSSSETIRQQIQEGRLNLKEIIFVGGRVVYDKEAEETYLTARVRYKDEYLGINEEVSSAEELIRNSLLQEGSEDRLIHQFSDGLLGKLSEIRQANRIHNKRVEKVFRHVEDGSFLMGMETLGEVAASEAVLTGELDLLVAELETIKKASVEYAVRVEKIASGFTILASIITVCLVIVVVFIIVRRNISRPLHMLTDMISSFSALQEVKETESEKDLMLRHDELGMLSRSFNKLKHDLSAQGRALQDAKEEAERANGAKSQFLAAASHDLRQPLHAMQMYIAALRQKVHDEDALTVVSDIDAVSVSTGRLLNALLDVSQLEAGAIKPQFEDFPIQEVLRRVARAFAPFAQRKDLDLRIVPSSAYVHSDPILLERIIGNFTSNAVRYTESGRILIGCRRYGDELSVEVLDTGPGIPEEQKEAIFDAFHQIHNKERDRSKGLGLGLSIAQRLAAFLGHRIEHQSILGRGARFAIYVERRESAGAGFEDDAAQERMLGDLQGITTLLIEDDAAVLHATKQLLESWGCTVLGAHTTDKALELVTRPDSPAPDIIIADYRLPDGSTGVEAITRVQLTLGSAVPALIITGDVEVTRLRDIADQGYRVLSKPVRPAKLRALVSHLLSGQTPPLEVKPTHMIEDVA